MSKIKPFNAGYFSIHNAVFDVMMPTLSPNAFKVLCVAIRQTMGWRKKNEVISYSQFMTLSGIKSRTTISAALAECLAHHYLTREERASTFNLGKPDYSYRLNTDLEIEYPDPSPEIGLNLSPEIGLNAPDGENLSPENGLSLSTENGLPSPENGLSLSPFSGHTTIHKEHHHDDDGSSPLSTAQQNAAAALETHGVTSGVAQRLAARCAPDLIAGWITHVQARTGLKSPAAFLVAVLKRGDPPPVAEAPADDPKRYITGAYADVIQH